MDSKNYTNYIHLVIPSKSQNEAFARMSVSAFASLYDPTAADISDIKSAVSEAVTNCIVHAYSDKMGEIDIVARNFPNSVLYIRIKDKGCGIPDIAKAMEPLFTTSTEGERAGLGFAVMESFMDKIKVTSKVGVGTTVTMWKKLTTKD